MINMRTYLTLAAVVIAAGILAASASATDEDPGPIFSSSDVRDLARTFISEAGWEDEREWAALGHTLRRRATRLRRRRGWSGRATLRAIADRALVEPRTDRQRWIHALDVHGARPDAWGQLTTAQWNETRADGLKAAIETARALVRGDLEDPCDGPSEYWGSRVHPVDRAALIENIRARLWVIVDCGLEGTAEDNVYVRHTTRRERETAPMRHRVRLVD